MSKVIQVRGANASGKSTVVGQFMLKREASIKRLKGRYPITEADDGRYVALGEYYEGAAYPGIDSYRNRDAVFDAVFTAIDEYRPELIVYEGLISSTTRKMALDLRSKLSGSGYSYKAIWLQRSLEDSVRLMRKRSRGGVLSVDNLIKKMMIVDRSTKSLMLAGVDVRLVRTDDVKYEDMGAILEAEL